MYLISGKLARGIEKFYIGVPRRYKIAGSGYILTKCGRLNQTDRISVKTEPRYASLVPKGSLSLTQKKLIKHHHIQGCLKQSSATSVLTASKYSLQSISPLSPTLLQGKNSG